MKEHMSDEYLHAFVDGELAADERERALLHLETDAEFKAKVCELRGLKERVKGAYAELSPVAARRGTHLSSPVWRQALVAGIMLVIGVAGGWLAHGGNGREPVYDRLAGLPSGYQPIALAGKVDPNKVVLHLDDNEPAQLSATLDLAKRLLDSRGARGRVEVVVNSYGLNLLRQDTSPYRERIERMLVHYPNLGFTACGQTIARLNHEGVQVKLLPGVHVGKAAVNEILNRLKQGWVYVKV